jgi:hypothetical protein
LTYNDHDAYTTLDGGGHGGEDETFGAGVDGEPKDNLISKIFQLAL